MGHVSTEYPGSGGDPELISASKILEINASQGGFIAEELCSHIYMALHSSTLEPQMQSNGERTQAGASTWSLASAHLSELLEDESRHSEDVLIGARAGLDLPLSGLKELLEIVGFAPTVSSTLKQIAGRFNLLQSDGCLLVSVEGDYALLEYQYRNGIVSRRRQIVELMAALLLRILRIVLPPQYWPRELHFDHLRGSERNSAKEIFDLPVVYGAETTALLFPRAALAHRVASLPDGWTSAAVVEPMAARQTAAYRSFVPNVAFYARRQIATGLGGMEEVARQLGVSRASLFRRLSAVNLQFTDIVRYIRMSTARYYLEESDVSIHDIASLIGYSEHSAFTRAFVRSFNCAPSEFRRESKRVSPDIAVRAWESI